MTIDTWVYNYIIQSVLFYSHQDSRKHNIGYKQKKLNVVLQQTLQESMKETQPTLEKVLAIDQ